MHAQDLIAELGNTLGIPLRLEDNVCPVIFDNDPVDFELAHGTLFAVAELGSAAGREDAYARLLQANFAGQETGGAVISLNDARFLLHMAFPEDTTYARFEADLERFVKSLRYWKEWLALPPAAQEPPVAEPLIMNNMLRI